MYKYNVKFQHENRDIQILKRRKCKTTTPKQGQSIRNSLVFESLIGLNTKRRYNLNLERKRGTANQTQSETSTPKLLPVLVQATT